MHPLITPKGMKSQPLFMQPKKEIKIIPLPCQMKKTKYIPNKNRKNSKKNDVRDKLNSFISNKYLQTSVHKKESMVNQAQQHSRGCSPLVYEDTALEK